MKKLTLRQALFTYSAVGIGIAAFISMCCSAVTGLVIGGDSGRMLVKQFGVILICGIGYGAPAIIWLNERLSTWAKLLIAIVPGTVIYTIAAWWMGWIPRQFGVWSLLAFIAVILVVTTLISMICGFVFRSDVRKMNEQLNHEQNKN